MFLNIGKQLKNISHSRWYWRAVRAMGVVMLVVALIYQHLLGERPCLLCIQIRLWVSLLVLVSFAGLLLRQNKLMNSIAHSLVVMISLGFVERSYQLLGTERGFIFSDFGFDLGLPAWFAIDQWLPSVYYVQTACGYTLELILGVIMAAALMLFSACLFLVGTCVCLASFLRRDV